MGASKVIKAKKTEVVKKEPNPNYNESFQFKVPSDSLDTISICVSVMQHAPGVKGLFVVCWHMYTLSSTTSLLFCIYPLIFTFM